MSPTPDEAVEGAADGGAKDVTDGAEDAPGVAVESGAVKEKLETAPVPRADSLEGANKFDDGGAPGEGPVDVADGTAKGAEGLATENIGVLNPSVV